MSDTERDHVDEVIAELAGAYLQLWNAVDAAVEDPARFLNIDWLEGQQDESDGYDAASRMNDPDMRKRFLDACRNTPVVGS